MAKLGRNEPCGCGSGRKAKRCCGVERGPSDESLARAYVRQAARDAVADLRRVSEDEFDVLCDELPDLPVRELSLHVELPKLVGPPLERLLAAIEHDDPDDGAEPFLDLLDRLDTPGERARLARGVVALRDSGRLDPALAAVALLDLASESAELVVAGLLEALAVRAGVARTPGGLVLAA